MYDDNEAELQKLNKVIKVSQSAFHTLNHGFPAL
jgi:hypothetical protein